MNILHGDRGCGETHWRCDRHVQPARRAAMATMPSIEEKEGFVTTWSFSAWSSLGGATATGQCVY